MKISGCVITYNEAEHIEACLESLNFCNEIVIIDSDSTDDTLRIVKRFAVKNKKIPVVVKNRKFTGFVEQKNFSSKIARNDWILNLDADERISPELRNSILQLTEKSPVDGGRISGFSMNRRNYYIDRWIRYCGWYPDKKIRLFHKQYAAWEGQLLHETVGVKEGKVKHLDGDIIHFSFADISDHLRKIDKYSTIAANEDFERGKFFPLPFIILRMITTFFRSYVVKKGILDGAPGFIISVMSSYHTWLKYIKLWYLHKKNNRHLR